MTSTLTDSLLRLRSAEHHMELDLRALEVRLDALGDDIAAARVQIAAQQRREHFGHAPEPVTAAEGAASAPAIALSRRGPRRRRPFAPAQARPAGGC